MSILRHGVYRVFRVSRKTRHSFFRYPIVRLDTLTYNDLSQVELWDCDASSFQKWTITYLNNGYYSIISQLSSKSLTVKTGEENTANSKIIQSTYTGSYNQQWKIDFISDTYYRISARSGIGGSKDWCISADDGILIFGNGWEVEQKEYVSGTIREQWELIGFIDATMVGIPEDGHDHLSVLGFASDQIFHIGFFDCDIYTSINSTSCVGRLAMSRLFFSRSHGSQTSILLNSDSLTNTVLNKLTSTGLSNCELVFFSACETGSGGSSGNNIVNKAFQKGATTVMGFQNSVNCGETNNWCQFFFMRLRAGYSIANAITYADTEIAKDYPIITTDCIYVAGSTSTSYYPAF